MPQNLSAGALPRLIELVFLRYLGASVVALAGDVGSFLLLLHMGMPALVATTAAYTLGILVHWLISSRLVFAGSVATFGSARHRQKALFVVAALAGLVLTMLIVGLGTRLGAGPRLAKAVAVVASFLLTWVLRRRVVFA